MSLVPHKITALAESDAQGTDGKNIVAGAVVSLYDTDGNAVILYDDENGSNGSTAKQTDAKGQVVVYVTAGESDEEVSGSIRRRVTVGGNGIVSYATTAELEATRPSKTGQRAENRERANAQYTLMPAGYVPVFGDVISSNGRAWMLQVGEYAYPPHFGIFESTADASSGLNSIAELYKKINGGGLTFSTTTTFDVSSVKELKNITIDYSNGATNTPAIECSGSDESDVTLGADATKGDKTITLSSSISLSKGDVILIKSDAIFDSFNTSSKIGELAIVESATGTSVTLEGGIFDTYLLSDAASARKVNMVSDVTFEKVVVIGNDTPANLLSGLVVKYGINVKVKNCTFSKTTRRGCVLDSCISSSVKDSFFYDFLDNSTGYGVSFLGPIRNSFARDNFFRNCRHAFTTNNSDLSQGITRFVSFDDNEVLNSEIATGGSGGDAIDTHAGAEYVFIERNTVVGSSGLGVNFECQSGSIKDNKIYETATDGIQVHNETDRQGSVEVSGNEVYFSGGRGISFLNGIRGTSATYDRAIIEKNTVRGSSAQGIYLRAGTGLLDFASVCVNDVEGSGSEEIRVESTNNVKINNNQTKSSNNYCIRIRNCKAFQANINTLVNDSTVSSIFVEATTLGGTDKGIITGNVFSSTASTTTEEAVTFNNNVTRTGVFSNQVSDTGGIDLGTGTGNTQANNIS